MLLSTFNNMSDYRRAQGKRFKLNHLLMIICIAILAGSTEYIEISSYIDEKFKPLKKLLKVKWKDPPSYSTIRRICIWSDSENLETVFRKYSRNLVKQKNTKGLKAIAIDGKVLRGSSDKGSKTKPIQLISAFLVDHKLVLAHADIINEKTNEIPKVQELLRELGVEKHVFTMDALHCQHKTLQAVVDSDNDAIIQVKNNQKAMHKLCQKISNSWNSIEEDVENTYDHSRQETRVAKVYLKNEYFKSHIDKKWYKNIESIIKIERTRRVFNTEEQKWEESYEKSYYVGTRVFKAKEANTYVRGHWGVENRLHYVRDVAMKEDSHKSYVNVGNLSRLRTFVFNILRINGVKNVKNELFRNCVSLDRITRYNFLFD